jgi:hypothetical protein
MFTFWSNAQKFCDGITRRNFLQVGAFGAGLTLADMLRSRAAAATTSKTPTGKAKSAIMIYLPGGPSHMDMYDLKPNAPKEFRGEFNPIATNVPGVEICEHFPMQAKMWDKMACVRSLVSVDEHSDTYTMTGYPDRDSRITPHPSFGAYISKMRSGDASVPPFVSLRGMSRGTEPAYLGIAHRPFTPSSQGQASLQLVRGVDMARLEDRKGLLNSFDDVRRDIDASGTMVGMDSFNTRAFDMVSSGTVRKALDLQTENTDTRSRYKGVEQFLTARRLVEAGVGCVTLSIGGWDTHGQNFTQLKRQLPQVDKGLGNLVQDLSERGLLDETMIVMWGEFGRTPKINNGAGRDHWSPVMSCFIAGGGLKMGQAIGSSTERAERPKDRPYKPCHVLATMFHQMGIDPSQTFLDGTGRPRHIIEERTLVSELL